MQQHSEDASLKAKREDDFTDSRSPSHLISTPQKSIEVGPLEKEEDKAHSEGVEDDQSYEDAQNQLVVYNQEANEMNGNELVPDSDNLSPPFPSYSSRNTSSRVCPSVGAYTVQCANCFKWRLIPTKEKYEEIRENILLLPFKCETAREWRPDISCDDPEDISQDDSRIWAIDKPNIAQPPPGWDRQLRIRKKGSAKFADVYYVSPSGKRLRSIVEIQMYLLEHPEYIRAGVTLAQFSFQVPKPLQDGYVKKRPARVTSSYDGSRPIEPTEANPLSWASPIGYPEMQTGERGLSKPYFEAPVFDSVAPPGKKQSTESPSKQMYDKSVYNQPNIKVEKSQESSNESSDL